MLSPFKHERTILHSKSHGHKIFKRVNIFHCKRDSTFITRLNKFTSKMNITMLLISSQKVKFTISIKKCKSILENMNSIKKFLLCTLENSHCLQDDVNQYTPNILSPCNPYFMQDYIHELVY